MMRGKNPAQTIGSIQHRSKWRDLIQRRQHCPPALHGTGDNDTLPVRQLLVAPLACRQRLTARGGDGNNAANAKLNRLLHHAIHGLAFKQGSKQREMQRRLIAWRLPAENTDADIIKAVAIEKRQRIAHGQTQDTGNMTMRIVVQLNLHAGLQNQRRKHPNFPHTASVEDEKYP